MYLLLCSGLLLLCPQREPLSLLLFPLFFLAMDFRLFGLVVLFMLFIYKAGHEVFLGKCSDINEIR